MTPWVCYFDQDDCGFTNQYNMAQFQLRNRRTDPTVNIFGKTSAMALNVSSSSSYQSAGRLETPYFPNEQQTHGCLTIEYLIYGPAIDSMSIIQQVSCSMLAIQVNFNIILLLGHRKYMFVETKQLSN